MWVLWNIPNLDFETWKIASPRRLWIHLNHFLETRVDAKLLLHSVRHRIYQSSLCLANLLELKNIKANL